MNKEFYTELNGKFGKVCTTTIALLNCTQYVYKDNKGSYVKEYIRPEKTGAIWVKRYI